LGWRRESVRLVLVIRGRRGAWALELAQDATLVLHIEVGYLPENWRFFDLVHLPALVLVHHLELRVLL